MKNALVLVININEKLGMMEESTPVNHSWNKITPWNWINNRIKPILPEKEHLQDLRDDGSVQQIPIDQSQIYKGQTIAR